MPKDDRVDFQFSTPKKSDVTFGVDRMSPKEMLEKNVQSNYVDRKLLTE